MLTPQVTEAVKNYLNYGAHLTRIADMGRVESRKGIDYLLCLGAYNSEEDKWVNQIALGKIFGDSPQTTSDLIKRLVDRGFIEVVQNEDDSRTKELRLTEKGTDVYECLARGLEDAPRFMPIDDNSPILSLLI